MIDSEIILADGNAYTPLNVKRYPDGSPLMGFLYLEYAPTMILRPKSLETFVSAMFYCDALEERGRPIDRLVLPFVPGGRQDRINPSGDYLFTLKSVAQMINARGFDEVITLDPHSNVTPALIDRCKVVGLDTVFAERYNCYDGVIAPDVGAAKRAFDVAQTLGVPFFQAEKHREVSTGKLSGFVAPRGLSSGGKYLVVDDICDGGGTFIGLAKEIRAEYSDVALNLWVTHGVFSKGTKELREHYYAIFTSDSTLFNRENVHTTPVAERLISWTR